MVVPSLLLPYMAGSSAGGIDDTISFISCGPVIIRAYVLLLSLAFSLNARHQARHAALFLFTHS